MPTLVVKTQPLTSELFAQDVVLLLKIVEGILLPLVWQVSKRNQYEPKPIKRQTHCVIIPPVGAAKGPRQIKLEGHL